MNGITNVGRRLGGQSMAMKTAAKFGAPHIAERERVLDAAVASGRFADSRRQFWSAQYDSDPTGTARVIASLAPAATVPAAASTRAEAAGVGPYNDRLLSGPERARIAAAKAGQRHGVITTEI